MRAPDRFSRLLDVPGLTTLKLGLKDGRRTFLHILKLETEMNPKILHQVRCHTVCSVNSTIQKDKSLTPLQVVIQSDISLGKLIKPGRQHVLGLPPKTSGAGYGM